MRRLSVRLVLAFWILVLLTALAVGLPAIWLIQDQLREQATSQLSQAQRTALSLYDKNSLELQNFAILTSQRPTLQALLAADDLPGLASYLETLQQAARLDLTDICSGGSLLTGTRPDVPACSQSQGSLYFGGPPGQPQPWMISRVPLASSQVEVIVGRQLDRDFASEISDQIGMHQLLFFRDQLVSSSLALTPSLEGQLNECLAGREEPDPQTSCTLEGTRYLLGRQALSDPDWRLVVALDASSLALTQHRLVYSMAAAILAVSLLGTGLGVILSRVVSRPLEDLSKTAEKFSRGDLETAFGSRSSVEEINRVAEALENARSELTRILRSLEAETQWSENLLASIVEAIITVDEQGAIRFFSRGAEQLTGIAAEEAADLNLNQIFQLAEGGQPFLEELLSGPADYGRLDVRLPNGRQITCAITTAQLNRFQGSAEPEKALVIRDISEEEAVHRLLGNFIANVAHELRTPLTALEASIEMLLDQNAQLAPEERLELYGSLYLGMLNLHTLIDNLLESANIEARHFRISPREVSLQPIVARAVHTMRPLIAKYDQRLTLELPLEIPPVKADPKRTEQVLVNLISNANRYGPPGEEIILQVKVEPRFVRLEVKDRGPGIPPDKRDDLFQRFEFPHDLNSASQAGAGLGLSVVKEIVSAHGGRVEVEDNPGGGSIFWFTLPRAEEGI